MSSTEATKSHRVELDETLPKCPFCGLHPRSGNAIPVPEHNSSFPEFVECKKCHIGFYGVGAKKKWSTRVEEEYTNTVVKLIHSVMRKLGGKNGI